VAKVSVGAIHDWRLAERVRFGVGGLYDFNFGGDPNGAMAFVRFKID